MNNFTFLDGISMSVFSIVVVFIVLFLLSVVITLFSKIINRFETTEENTEQTETLSEVDEDEERLVAQIVASCILQGEEDSNVRIKSIVRIK